MLTLHWLQDTEGSGQRGRCLGGIQLNGVRVSAWPMRMLWVSGSRGPHDPGLPGKWPLQLCVCGHRNVSVFSKDMDYTN